MRWSLALAGSALYSCLWALGMGEHDLRLLLLAPLPAVLAISYGYSAVMNASGDLSREGRISVAEALACLALTLLLTLVMSALAAACLALLLSRGLGLVSRSIALRRYPTDSTRSLPSVLRTQRWFLFSTALVVFHGQADLLALGFAGGLGLVAVYGPLLRTTYSTLLIAEALSWMLFGRFGDDIVDAAQPHSRRGLLGDWRRVGLAVGIGIAVVFSVVAEPFLELLLAEPLEGMALPVLLLSVLIVVRFWTFVQGVQLTRAGVQRERIPALAVGGVIVLSAALLVGGASIPTAIAVLTGARLLSETVVCAWYTKLARSLPARAALR